MAKRVTTKFDFSLEPPVPGTGSSHSSTRIALNEVKPSLFNEYERIMTALVEAVGDYEFSDTIPDTQDNIGSAVRTMFGIFTNDINDLETDKFEKAGGTITGEVTVQARLSVRSVNVQWQSGKLYKVHDLIVYDGKIYQCITQHTSGTAFLDHISCWKLAGGGGSTSRDITLANHGFLVGDILRYDVSDSDHYVLARANTYATLGLFIVSSVQDIDNFTIMQSGYFKDETSTIAFTPGSWYYLSDTSAGAVTTIEPNISQRVLYAISASEAYVVMEKPQASAQSVVDTFTATPGQTNFTLTVAPDHKNLTWLTIGGVPQKKSDYSISGNELITGAVPGGTTVEFQYFYSLNFIPTANMQIDSFTAMSGETEFTLSYEPIGDAYALVFVGGIKQPAASYELDGTTLRFGSTVTEDNTTIDVWHVRTANVLEPADDTVTTVKVHDRAITGPKVGLDAIDNEHLTDDCVHAEQIMSGEIEYYHINPADMARIKSETQEATLTAMPNIPAPIRQTVYQGYVDANGYADFLNEVTADNVSILGSVVPCVMAFADGMNDYIYTEDSDTAPAAWANLTGIGIWFLYADYNTTTETVTYGKTRVRPQYGQRFDITKNVLMHFDGDNASTDMIDEYGNVWTAMGNAQLSTGDKKFGTASLELDGTGDYIKNETITSLGDRFCIEFWFHTDNTGTANQTILYCMNSSSAGLLIRYNEGGSGKLHYYISTTGSSFNIANSAAGTKNSWSNNQWYHLRLEWDGATFKSYIGDGSGASVLDYSVAMTSPINAITKIHLGAGSTGIGNLDGGIDEFRMDIGYTREEEAFTPAVAAYSPDAIFFDINKMKMYEGAPGAWTEKIRLFLGEAIMAGNHVTSVVTYALKGYYDSGDFAVIGNGDYTKNHNIGAYGVMKFDVLGRTGAGYTYVKVVTETVSGSSYGATAGIFYKTIKIRVGTNAIPTDGATVYEGETGAMRYRAIARRSF